MRMRTALLLMAAALAAIGARAGDARAAGDEGENAAEKSAGDGEIFESIARGAEAAADVGVIVGALVDRCADEKRSLDRARCQATLAYLRRTLPERAFSITARDPAAILVSSYDEALKGYRISL